MRTGMILAFLALCWTALTGSLSLPNLLLGAVVGLVPLYLLQPGRERPRALRKLRRVIALALIFIYDLVLSATKVAVLVLRPDMHKRLRPAFIAVPLKAKSNAEITLLANLVTLTPGTLSVDVSADRSILFVHALNCEDREVLIREISEGFERRVIEVFE